MAVDTIIAAVIYCVVQEVIFGAGCVAVLAGPLSADAPTLIPWAAILSLTLAVPSSSLIAPRLKARFEFRDY